MGKFAAHAGGIGARGDGGGGRRVDRPEFDPFDMERLDGTAIELAVEFFVEVEFVDCFFADLSFAEPFFDEPFFGDLCIHVFIESGMVGGRHAVRQVVHHGNVDVLEDAAGGDAEDAVGGFDEVVTFASAVLAAEMIDEAERGAELFGFDEETGAVRLPLL